MYVKDVITMACQFLDKAELGAKISTSNAVNVDEVEVLSDLIIAFNLVRDEISTEILPNVKIDKLKTQNLKVYFKDFASYPVNIIAVKDTSGRNVRNRILNDSIIAFANEIEVWYTAKPETLTIDDEFSSTLPERVYAYGVVREYYTKKALYRDARIWEERFKNSIGLLESKKVGRMLPRRR